MFPQYIKLERFLDKKICVTHPWLTQVNKLATIYGQTYFRSIYGDKPHAFDDNIYYFKASAEVYNSAKEIVQLIGSVLVYKNFVYKIINVEKFSSSVSYPIHFTLEEYTDDYIEKLKSRLKQIKQQLLVSTDCIEEIGGNSVASDIREYAEELTLEKLV